MGCITAPLHGSLPTRSSRGEGEGAAPFHVRPTRELLDNRTPNFEYGRMTDPKAGKPAAPRSRLRSFAARMLLLIVTLGLCLAIMEIAVRILCPYFRPEAQVPYHFNSAAGIVLGTPNSTARQATPKGDYDSVIHYDADGFRDSKNLNECRASDWVVLGDSYTMGWGVLENERFSTLLEQAFKENSRSPSLRVFNAAMPDNIIGYQRMLKYAESRGASVSNVIVGICMENDLCDYRDGKSAWDDIAGSKSSGTKKENLRSWFKAHSALYIAASYSLQKIRFLRGLMEKAGIARDIDTLTGKAEWNETVLRTSRDEVVKLVAGRRHLILIIPSRRLWEGQEKEIQLRIHEGFVSLLRESGLNVLDLKAAFEAQGDPISLYYKTDPHWNPRGHAVAARELFRAIQGTTNDK